MKMHTSKRNRVFSKKGLVCLLTAAVTVRLMTPFYSKLTFQHRGNYPKKNNVVYDHSDNDENDNIALEQLKLSNNNQDWTSKFEIRILDPNVFKHIQINNEYECSSRKFLVYTCGRYQCKGCGDRIKGIVAMFLMALLSNRTFVVRMDTPCDFSTIFQPNIYNWKICLPYIRSIPRNYKLTVDASTGVWKFLTEDFDFEANWKRRITYVFADTFMFGITRHYKFFEERLNWIVNLTDIEVAHRVINTLLKPSQRMFNEVDNFYKRLDGNPLACSHIRTGLNNMLHLTYKRDKANQTAIFNFLSRLDTQNLNYFIIGDHPGVKEEAYRTFEHAVSLNYSLVDLELYRDDPSAVCDGFYGAYIEWYILSTCDVLVISESGFGCTSLLVRGTSENLYAYKSGNVAKRDIESLYKYCRVF